MVRATLRCGTPGVVHLRLAVPPRGGVLGNPRCNGGRGRGGPAFSGPAEPISPPCRPGDVRPLLTIPGQNASAPFADLLAMMPTPTFGSLSRAAHPLVWNRRAHPTTGRAFGLVGRALLSGTAAARPGSTSRSALLNAITRLGGGSPTSATTSAPGAHRNILRLPPVPLPPLKLFPANERLSDRARITFPKETMNTKERLLASSHQCVSSAMMLAGRPRELAMTGSVAIPASVGPCRAGRHAIVTPTLAVEELFFLHLPINITLPQQNPSWSQVVEGHCVAGQVKLAQLHPRPQPSAGRGMSSCSGTHSRRRQI